MKTRGPREKQYSPTELAELFANSDPDWLEVKVVSKSIGLGVFATKELQKGDFIVNYRGELSLERKIGAAIFGIEWRNKLWTIDATDEISFGRFINDTDPFHKANCEPHLHSFIENEQPACVLWFRALKQIEAG